ncbi:MAG: DcaP family trimeric outer membrane transporter [Pseudomonadota bacterium]
MNSAYTRVSGFFAGAVIVAACAPALAGDGRAQNAEPTPGITTTSVNLSSLLSAAEGETQTNGFRSSADTTVTFGGYVKLDAMITDFNDGALPTNSLGRDFYLPALVPVGGEDESPVFDLNPRETRFLFGLDSVRGGREISGKIEFDFQVTSDGNERVSNSFTPRMRQAYITVDGWLFGQAWSTFQDVSALPDNLDFIGPAESTTFERQPMIRYTRGPWQFAIEQPETTIADLAAGGARLTPGQDTAPDAVLRYNHKRNWGHLTATTIVRALNIEEDFAGSGSQDDTAIGFGGAVSGKIKLGRGGDDIRFMGTIGDGIGRYIGLNLDNDAFLTASGDLETIPTTTGFVSLRHFWTKTLRSNATFGYFTADTPANPTAPLTDEAMSVHANLISTPVEKFQVGLEYIYAMRSLDDGAEGDFHRLQFSVIFGF